MLHKLTLAVLLAAAWLLWSGLYKPLLLALGAFSCLLVVYLVRRMDLVDRDVFPLHAGIGIFAYWGWLLKEIVKSNIDVARMVLSPAMPISPTLIELDAMASTDAGRVIFANSITLTPGTVTLDIFEGRLLVHALTKEGAAALEEGEMNRRVARLGEG